MKLTAGHPATACVSGIHVQPCIVLSWAPHRPSPCRLRSTFPGVAVRAEQSRDASSADSPSSSSALDASAPVKCASAAVKAAASSSAKEIQLPKKGYFAIADTNAEVYSKSTEPFDPRNKGGRYKNEFIWNTNWQETLKRDEQLDKKRQEFLERQASGTSAAVDGGVRLGMLADLNNMTMDLSSAFRKKQAVPQAALPRQRAASSGPMLAKRPMRQAAAEKLEPMSRLNAEKIKRQNRGSMRAPTQKVISMRSEDELERERLAEEERVRYELRKGDFQSWTLALIAVGGVATYTSYSVNVFASYLTGALGGLMYLRLLSRSVDAIGGESVSALVSQPRLLIPVILAAVFNRWNVLYADQVGITLQLLPMLLGFFTYKIAVLARESQDLFAELSVKPSTSRDRGR